MPEDQGASMEEIRGVMAAAISPKSTVTVGVMCAVLGAAGTGATIGVQLFTRLTIVETNQENQGATLEAIERKLDLVLPREGRIVKLEADVERIQRELEKLKK